MATRRIDFLQALVVRHQLDQAGYPPHQCETFVYPAPDGDGWIDARAIFSKCPECKRLRPPASDGAGLCCDCQIEQQEDRLREMVLRETVTPHPQPHPGGPGQPGTPHDHPAAEIKFPISSVIENGVESLSNKLGDKAASVVQDFEAYVKLQMEGGAAFATGTAWEMGSSKDVAFPQKYSLGECKGSVGGKLYYFEFKDEYMPSARAIPLDINGNPVPRGKAFDVTAKSMLVGEFAGVAYDSFKRKVPWSLNFIMYLRSGTSGPMVIGSGGLEPQYDGPHFLELPQPAPNP